LPADATVFERLLHMMGGWGAISPYLYAVIIVIAGYLLAKISTKVIQRMDRPGITTHTITVMQKIVFYLIIGSAFILALQKVGVKLSNLLAAAGIVTVAVSFAAQTSVSNVISGIFLLFDRPFSIGDTIKVDTTLGVVQSIGLLSSKVRTFDNLVVRIPNEALLKSTIINYSLVQVRRIDISVTVSQEADLARVRELLLSVMREHVSVLDEPAPAVLTDLTTETGVVLIARVWVLSSEFVQIRSDLTTSVIELLKSEGIPRPRQYWAHVEK
jgi:small-conductance mechanosensitive channel